MNMRTNDMTTNLIVDLCSGRRSYADERSSRNLCKAHGRASACGPAARIAQNWLPAEFGNSSPWHLRNKWRTCKGNGALPNVTM